jgi:hypothetical protein
MMVVGIEQGRKSCGVAGTPEIFHQERVKERRPLIVRETDHVGNAHAYQAGSYRVTRSLTLGEIQRVRQSSQHFRKSDLRKWAANLVNLSRKVQPDPEGSSTPELPIVPLAGFVERQGEETDSNLAAKSRGFLQKAEMACFTGQGVRVRGGQACAETAQCVPPFETHRNIGEW